MRFRVLLVAPLLVLAALSTGWSGEAKVNKQNDIVFGKGGDADLQLDLCVPQGDGPFPAVVCIHGGGWSAGNRKQLTPLTELLAKNNFVAVTVTYRLTPKHRFPAQIEDCKAAVRWLRANAEKHKVHKDRIGAVGFSAGGHLACLLGAADEKAGLEGNGGNAKESSRVQAVVSFFGPTDFIEKTWTPQVEDTFLKPLLGGSYEEKKAAYRKCSPLDYCSKDDPPFLFFHGDKDELVGLHHSQSMKKKLREVGVAADLVTMEGDGHGWGGEKLTKTLNQTVRFFEEKLRK